VTKTSCCAADRHAGDAISTLDVKSFLKPVNPKKEPDIEERLSSATCRC
jgi:hypothetical protein